MGAAVSRRKEGEGTGGGGTFNLKVFSTLPLWTKEPVLMWKPKPLCVVPSLVADGDMLFGRMGINTKNASNTVQKAPIHPRPPAP
jgi:hypothetical protein